MADIRSHPEQDQDHEGASPSELLIEAARRDNVDLLNEVIASIPDPDKLSSIINNTKTVLGNYVYHEAALRGNYDIIDALLDTPSFECDPISLREGDTPLHSAIRYVNSQDLSNPDVISFSIDLVQMMIDAGSDPRIKNKAKLTPYQLTDPRNEKLRDALQNAVDVMLLGGGEDDGAANDGVDYALEAGGGGGEDGEAADDVGSASDSDFDQEEYKKEMERRKREKAEKAKKGSA